MELAGGRRAMSPHNQSTEPQSISMESPRERSGLQPLPLQHSTPP